MNPSIQLAPIPNCELSRTGAKLQPSLNYESWIAIGKQLCQVSACTNWWLGDWGNYGVKEYGDKSAIATQLAEELGIDAERVRQSMSVAASLGTRVPTLQWSHHREVRALDHKAQAKWLGMADKNKWSVSGLRIAIRADQAEFNDNEPNPKLFVWAKTADDLVRYLRAMDNEKPIEQWPQERKDAVRAHLEDVHKLYERVCAV